MNQDWITSFEALRSVYLDEAYSNIAINEAIPRHKGCRDSFVRTMVKGTLRDTIRLDNIIGQLASGGLRSIKKRTLIVIRMGLYALRSMDSVPEHAAVDESVKLARNVARGTDRFVNAVLRSYLRQRNELEKEPDDLALKYSFPTGLVDLIENQYGSETEKILAGLNTPPPVIIRVNELKTDADKLIRTLSDQGIEASPVDESGRALAVKGNGLLSTEEFKNGSFSIQSLSSIKAIEALCPSPGSKVLDMCAAPGGKTTMMAEMMGDTGSITACDIYEHRLELIKATAARLGIRSISTRLLDGTAFDAELENAYDYVLADVPCSGLGVISTKPEIKLRSDPEKYDELTGTQLDILRNAVRYAKPGGIICYSTCTLNRNENDGITGKLLNECSFVRIVEKNTILPYNNLVGFYYCIFRKNA